MIDRVRVKLQVKEMLRGRWLHLFLGLLLVELISIALNLLLPSFGLNTAGMYAALEHGNTAYFAAQYGGVLISVYTISLLSGLFLFWPLTVSIDGMFLKFLRGKNPPATSVFDALHYYKSAVLSMAWRQLFTFLWMLLLFIPGIVKAYSYELTSYIVAENPEINYRQALRLSMRLTDGYKGQMFVRDLSFFGWLLLAPFTLGILYIWLLPYMYTTRTAYYEEIKQQCMESGRVTAEDFAPQA